MMQRMATPYEITVISLYLLFHPTIIPAVIAPPSPQNIRTAPMIPTVDYGRVRKQNRKDKVSGGKRKTKS